MYDRCHASRSKACVAREQRPSTKKSCLLLPTGARFLCMLRQQPHRTAYLLRCGQSQPLDADPSVHIYIYVSMCARFTTVVPGGDMHVLPTYCIGCTAGPLAELKVSLRLFARKGFWLVCFPVALAVWCGSPHLNPTQTNPTLPLVGVALCVFLRIYVHISNTL